MSESQMPADTKRKIIGSLFKEYKWELQQAVETAFGNQGYGVCYVPTPPATRLGCHAAMPRPLSCRVEDPTTNVHL